MNAEQIMEIIKEAGDIDGIPGLFSIEEAAEIIIAGWQAEVDEMRRQVDKWEYRMELVDRTRTGKHLKRDVLDTLGIGGWELVNIHDDIAYFKRPLEDTDGEIKEEVQNEEEAKEEGEDKRVEEEGKRSTYIAAKKGFTCTRCGSFIEALS